MRSDRSMLSSLFALALLAVMCGAAAQSTKGGGAKDLFFGDDRVALQAGFRPAPPATDAGTPASSKPAPSTAPAAAPGTKPAAPPAKTHPGLRVWLTDTQDKRLSPTSTFRTGDKFRLFLQANRDGYLYLINIGTSGTTRVMFPRAGQSNRIARHQEFSLSSAIVFGQPSGTEQLVAVLSATPIDDAAVQLSNGSTLRVSLKGNSGTAVREAAPGGGAAGGRDSASQSLDLALADLKGSKDLQFDDEGGELVAVSRREDKPGAAFAPVVVNLRLTHR